jgi:tetratricopeptide (TPR) repeat protein
LALRIAAMSARSLPADKLTSYTTRLKTQDRLDGLSRPVGDQGVRESFDLSYDALPARLRHLLALLGLHPGPDFGPEVTAALLGSTVDIATADLAGLAEASLLIRTDVDRYRFHDLIREYAAGLVPDDREAAEIRMLDWYLHSSFAGMSQLYTTRFGDYLSPPAPGITPQHLPDDAAVYDWFQTEWSNLIPLPSWAADHGYLSHAWQLPATFWSYLNTRRRWQDHRALYAAAAAAARSQGSVAGESWMLGNLGSAQLYVGDVAGAVESQREARRLSQLIGDNAGEAADICNLGMALQRQGDLAGAVDLFRSALDVEPSRPGRAATLVNLSDALRNLGALDEARETAIEACRIYRETGQGFSLAFAEGNVGEACLALGELAAASAHLSECLAIARAYDAVSLEAEATAVIALVHEASGDLPKAYRTAAEARALLAGSGTPEAEAIKSRISHLTG